MTHRRFGLSGLSLLALLAVAALTQASAPAVGDDPAPSRQAAKDDLKKLQGTWECVSMEREGDEVPAEHLKGTSVVYEDDLATLYRDGELFRQSILTLDPSKKPKRINSWDLAGPYADDSVPGIYEIDGDTLKLCFSRPKVARPSEFTTKKEPGFLYVVYKRKKP
jgi:uncharacterized protein (TIGR03067 family)